MNVITAPAAGLLREQVRASVITPGDAGYDQARPVHNGMIDRQPEVIIRAEQVAGVNTGVAHVIHGARVPEASATMHPYPAADEDRIRWVRDYHQATAPYAEPGGYINSMSGGDGDQVRDNCRGNYRRLAQLKNRCDPANLFRINQNARPEA